MSRLGRLRQRPSRRRRAVGIAVVALLMLGGCTSADEGTDDTAETVDDTLQSEHDEQDEQDERDDGAPEPGPWDANALALIEEGDTPELLAERFFLALGGVDGSGRAPDRPLVVGHALDVLLVLDELPQQTADDITAVLEEVRDSVTLSGPIDPAEREPEFTLDDFLADGVNVLAHGDVVLTSTARPTTDGVTRHAVDGDADEARLRIMTSVVLAADREIAARWGTSVSSFDVGIADTPRLDGSGLAYSSTRYSPSFGWIGPCMLVFGQDILREPPTNLLSAVYHEVVHCHQRELSDDQHSPHWSVEGFAMWAGEWRAGGTSLAGGHWDRYLGLGRLPVNAIAYEAIGLWAHLDALGPDPWEVYPAVHAAFLEEAALVVLDDATGGEFSRTWGPSRWHVPDWGALWTAAAPASSSGQRLPVVGSGGASGIDGVGALGFAVDLDAAVAEGAEVLKVTRGGASHLRWVEADVDASAADTVMELFCLQDECVCPDGSELPAPTTAAPATTGLLAVAAATTPEQSASIAVQPSTMAELCGCDGTATTTSSSIADADPSGDHGGHDGGRVPAGPDDVLPADGDACDDLGTPEPTDGGCPSGSYTLHMGYFASTMSRLLQDVEVVATGGRVEADYLDGVFEARVEDLTLAAVLPGGVDLPVEIVMNGVFGGTYEASDGVLTFTSTQVDLATTVSAGGVAMGDAIELDSGDIAGGLLTASDVTCTAAGFTQVPRVEPRVQAVWTSR